MQRVTAVILAILLSVSNTAFAIDRSCDSWLTRAGQIAVMPVHMAKDGFDKFWVEQKEQGWKRWLIAPRKNPDRFDRWSWLEPADLPFELTSFARVKILKKAPLQKRLSKWVSAPISAATWISLSLVLLFNTMDNQVEAFDAYLNRGVFGADYVADWLNSEEIELGPAVTVVANGVQDFKKGLLPLWQRTADFQKTGVWTAEQAALAEAIIGRLIANHAVNDILLQDKLVEAASADPDFAKLRDSLPQEKQFSLALWLVPEVSVYGHSDSYWLTQLFLPGQRDAWDSKAIRGLNSLASNDRILDHAIPLTTLAQMTAFALGQPQEVEAKFQESVRLKISGDPDYIYRADFPIFQSDQVFHEVTGDRTVTGEMVLWDLIQHDVRFQGLEESVQAGQVSEFEALVDASARIGELNEVYSVYANDGLKPSTEEVCELIYGDAKGNDPNAYFAPLQSLGFDPKTVQVQGAFAYATYESLVNISQAPSPDAARAEFELGQNRQSQVVADFKAGKEVKSGFAGCAPAVPPAY